MKQKFNRTARGPVSMLYLTLIKLKPKGKKKPKNIFTVFWVQVLKFNNCFCWFL